MLSIAPKFRALLVDHIEQAQPDELAVIVERLLGDVGPPARNGAVLSLPRGHLARLPFAQRAIKLGSDGLPLATPATPCSAVYDPLLDITWPTVDLSGDELEVAKQDQLAHEFRLFALTDWRLPTAFELQSIVNRSRYNPAVDPAALTMRSGYYWTSEEYAPVSGCRWCVHLDYGDTDALPHSDTACARAVRSGQCFELRY